MILVDPRAGSSDLLPQLVARGLPASMYQMEYGDVSFLGNGPSGPMSVGVEYKRTGDALACMTGGRFAGHQLPGLMQTYQHYWLLVEGITRCGQDNGSEGVLQVRGWPEGWKDYRQGSRYVMWRDYQNWLMSLQQMGGVKVAQTASLKESATWIGALYAWWQKQWHDHKSVGTIYTAPFTDNGSALANIATAPSLSRLWAMQLPGVGQDKSKVVAMAFPTALELANADESRWQMVSGIGKTLASRIVASIRERAK